jgi:hypothetical protein
MAAEIELFHWSPSSPDITQVDFFFLEVGWRAKFTKYSWMQEKLLVLILDAVFRMNYREDKLRRKTHDFRTLVAKCTEIYRVIFGQVL